jgi:hypothetical protein
MFLPQSNNHILLEFGNLKGYSVRFSGAIQQPVNSMLVKPINPFVSGFSADFKTPAQFTEIYHRTLRQINKLVTQHHNAFIFPWHNFLLFLTFKDSMPCYS